MSHVLEGELFLGYIKGPEGNIICLIKTEPEEKYTLGEVIRFNTEGMSLSRLYQKNIREISPSTRHIVRNLIRERGVYSYIEEFVRAFEEMNRYKTQEDY